MKTLKLSIHSVLSFFLLSTVFSCKTDITGPTNPQVTTTNVTAITQLTASSGGTISDDGGATVTARGVCWSTASGPTVSDKTKTSDGSGKGDFVSSLNNLTPGTKYYVRAYALNKFHVAYGNEVSFTTSPVNKPLLTTTAVSSINTTSAQSGGDIISEGGSPVTARGVCWGTSSGPTVSDNNKTTNGQGNGEYVSALDNLTPNTKYYVRAYATNVIGTSYGNEINFTTDTVVVKLKTMRVYPISLGSSHYKSGGAISWDGGATITARGVCWSASPNPTIANYTTNDGSGAGTFVSQFTFGVLYQRNIYLYVRAYAITSAGTFYGNEVSFIKFYRSPY